MLDHSDERGGLARARAAREDDSLDFFHVLTFSIEPQR